MMQTGRDKEGSKTETRYYIMTESENKLLWISLVSKLRTSIIITTLLSTFFEVNYCCAFIEEVDLKVK